MESGSGGGGVRAATLMAVVDGPRPGSWGGARIPAADGVLVAAVGLVLTGAGLPEVAILRDGEAAGTGFLAVALAGEARPRAAVTWYEDGMLAGGPDAPAGRIGDCERALLRAGFRVEYAAGTAGGCLVAWRRSRVR
jgi:hypothetical protein